MTVPVVPPPVVVTQVPQPTVVVSPVYAPTQGRQLPGPGGAADPDAGALDTGTVVLLIGGGLLVLGGGVALARRRVS